MLDNATVLLRRTREKSRDIFEGDQRNVEAIAESHEAGTFDRSIDIERAGQHARLIGDDAHGAAVEARESYDHIFGVVLLHFEKVSVVHDGMDHVLHVVW